jgi:hypothetical protein
MAAPTEEIARDFDPLKEERLELGTKVFKASSPSNAKPARSLRKKPKIFEWQKTTTKIHHILLLEPTLKRQRKKKVEREKAKRSRERRKWKWDAFTKHEKAISVSDIFLRKRGNWTTQLRSFRRNIDGSNNVHKGSKPKVLSPISIRRLGRCAGVKRISDLKIYDNKPKREKGQSPIPPPFEPKSDDPYIVPEPGQLISYLWQTRPSPIFDRKLYRTGVLCSTSGTGKLRFFETESDDDDDDDEGGSKSSDYSDEREYYEDKFYLNKKAFKLGNFRIRNDLVEGAICYEREKKFACRLLEIDEMSGAVLVQKLLVQRAKPEWISPDDLVGNYQIPKRKKERKSRNVTKLRSKQDHVGTDQCTPSETSENSGQDEHCADTTGTHQMAIDLTEEGGYQSSSSPPPQPSVPMHVSSDSHLIPETVSVPRNHDLNYTHGTLEMPTSWYTPMGLVDPASRAPVVGPTMRLQSMHSRIQNMSSSNGIEHSIMAQSPQQRWSQPALDGSLNNLASMGAFGMSSSGMLSATPEQMFSDRLTMMNQERAIRMELNFIQQQNMAVKILMTSDDLATIVACLQFIDCIQQRGITIGPTEAEIVSQAEIHCRILMEDTLLKNMAGPAFTGGKGYDIAHAAALICRLKSILGPNLGRLDAPSLNATQLLRLGLNGIEASDIFPYIQLLEDDILLKSISLKRQLTHAQQMI